jgi:hypothetical protein
MLASRRMDFKYQLFVVDMDENEFKQWLNLPLQGEKKPFFPEPGTLPRAILSCPSGAKIDA